VKPGVKPAFADTGQQRWPKMAKDGQRWPKTDRNETKRKI